MITALLLIAISLIVLLIATYTDFKTGEVPDWLSYSYISMALGIRLLHSIVYNDWMFLLYGLIGLGAMVGFGLLAYYTRQWGGGDAKILMGMGAAFATAPFGYSSSIPYLAVLLVNILIAGGIYGIGWSAYVFASNFKSSMKAVKEFFTKYKLRYMPFIVFCLFAFIASFFFSGMQGFVLFYGAIAIWLYMLLFVVIKASEKAGMYSRMPVKDITEGEWVAEDVRAKGKLICSKKSPGITVAQIRMLKKYNVRSVLVKKGIKFIVALLAGLVITLILNEMAIMLLF